MDISITYKNFEVDEGNKHKQKQDYAKFLQQQIDIKKNQKELEKQRKKKEEEEEEARLQKEREILQMKYDVEKGKLKLKMNNIDNENQKNMVDKKRKENEDNKNQNEKAKKIDPKIVKFVPQNQQPENQNNYQNNNYYNNQNNDYNYPPNIDLSKQNDPMIEQELLNIRATLMEQQNELLRQVNELKSQTQLHNKERYEALNELNNLKEELSKNRADEEVRKKFVYDVVVENNNKVNEIYKTTKLPQIIEDELKVDLMNPSNKKINSQLYDDAIKYPNRIPVIPDLNELNDNRLDTESKFIDLDDHGVHNVIINYLNLLRG